METDAARVDALDVPDTAPLLGEQESSNGQRRKPRPPIPVEPLTYADLTKVASETDRTLKEDPLDQYLIQTDDRVDNIFTRSVINFIRVCSWLKYVYTGTGWTVNHGDSFMCYSDPAVTIPRFLTFLDGMGARVEVAMKSPEQLKRLKEIQTKLRPAMFEFFEKNGGRNMIAIEHVGTSPAKQGHGYGTALCKIATAQADARGMKSYLVSSNIKTNTGFYNNLGYFSAAKVVLGEDNPTWHKEPVTIEIMIREPKATVLDIKTPLEQ